MISEILTAFQFFLMYAYLPIFLYTTF
jgi:hypothetical protein